MSLLLWLFPTEDVGLPVSCRLVDCQLTENCCEDLAYMITTTKHLKSLDLGNNALGDKGVITLCEGLKQSGSSLRRLG